VNILVTGGAGYIGSVTVELLVQNGERVVVYDNLVKGHRAAVHPDAVFVQGDLSDAATLTAALRDNQVEAVMHFAAYSLVGESGQQPAKYFANNVANSVALVNAMVAAGAQSLVFSSTAAVYGEPESTPIRETDPREPTNAYGESKLAFERMLPWFAQAYGLRYTSLRYFNAAGASARYGEAHTVETHLIPLLLQVALDQRPAVSIFGGDYPTPDGTAVRDYIHVLDLADAHLLAVDHLAKGGASAALNLGNGKGFSVREVIEAARRVTGHPIPTRSVARRAGDPAALVAGSERIKAELGWTPRYPDLERIIGDAWAWHREHPNGYAGT